VPTGAFTPPPSARSFVLRVAAWSLGLFGLLRLPGVQTSVLLPVTQLQGSLATRVFGTPSVPIEVTLACSGADAIAICAGFILGYPATWSARIRAAAGGIATILALNTLRIGTLGHATSPAVFEALHIYLWPAVLILAIAGYVLTWMRREDLRAAQIHPIPRTPIVGALPRTFAVTPTFVLLAGALLVLFTAAAPLYLDNRGVLLVAALMARCAAEVLSAVGMEATVSANVLYTGRTGFVVTQECISTPLIPIYVAGAIAYAGSSGRRAGLLLAAVPLFIALGVARLLVVALPAALVDSPLTLVHAFYQLLLAAVIVCFAAVWRYGAGPTATLRAGAGVSLGVVCLMVLWPHGTSVVASVFPSAVSTGDPQGVIALLPAFQLALYGALCVGLFAWPQWRMCAAGLGVLALLMVAEFVVLDLLQRQVGFVPHVRDLRAWALGGPVLLVIALVKYERATR
jgi:exosortase/archaeosortase family protein